MLKQSARPLGQEARVIKTSEITSPKLALLPCYP
jgi:hypothetical protein